MEETGFPFSRSEPVVLTEDHIVSVLLVRRARDEILGENLFSDPAWDILLELFAAKLGGREITVSELPRAVELPHSTTVRWVSALQQQGLVESAAIGEGAISLSAEGASRMERLGNRWASGFLAIA